MGGRHPIVWGDDWSDKKIEGHGAMALGGRNFIERNNNQPTVGVRGWVEMVEETLPRWRAWGGVVPSFGATN